jgi:hypothetical protein
LKTYRIFTSTIILVSLLLISCGNKKRPTGGKKDLVNPTILSVSPNEFSDISDKTIEVVFSKPIERNSILSGLYIYPPIVKKKFKWDKNILQIKINEELDKDTNYFFTFRTTISGEHNNKLDQEYLYIFRTGKLNEKKVSGKFMFEDEVDIGQPIQVELLSADSISIFSKTISEPFYNFEYLNEEEQILKAFIDKNGNKIYNYGTEPYFEETIPNEKIVNLNPFLAYEDTIKPDVKSAKAVYTNRVDVEFTESIASISEITIIKSDSLNSIIPVQASLLDDISLMIISDFSDTLNYNIVFGELTDKKNNVQDSSSVLVSSTSKIDSFPPQLLNISPRDGSVAVTLLPEIFIEFDEIVEIFEIQFVSTESNEVIQLVEKEQGNSLYIPTRDLKNYVSYHLNLKASDVNGNMFAAEKVINIICIKR